MNIVFWSCQGLRPKLKELQNCLLENQIDILALNKTFLKMHISRFTIFRPENPCRVKNITYKKFPESDLAFTYIYVFLVLKKSKIMTSHQGIIIRLSMEETMIS